MVDWPQEDLVNWVEWRLRHFEVDRENAKKGFGIEGPDHPLSERDLRIWLAYERDDRSLTEIARKQFARYWKTGKGKRDNQRAVSLVRNAIARVEKFLNRNGKEFNYPKKMRDELNASIQDFFTRPRLW
jgi:hypothetical protein